MKFLIISLFLSLSSYGSEPKLSKSSYLGVDSDSKQSCEMEVKQINHTLLLKRLNSIHALFTIKNVTTPLTLRCFELNQQTLRCVGSHRAMRVTLDISETIKFDYDLFSRQGKCVDLKIF